MLFSVYSGVPFSHNNPTPALLPNEWLPILTILFYFLNILCLYLCLVLILSSVPMALVLAGASEKLLFQSISQSNQAKIKN